MLLALFAADVGVSFAQAAGLTRRLRALEDLAQGVRRLSDALTEHIGEGAMTADTLLDEQKLQLMLAAMEGRDNAAALRAQLLDLAAGARAQYAGAEKLARQRFFGAGRLLRAFPKLRPERYKEALEYWRRHMDGMK